MGRTISENIIDLSPLDAFKFYAREVRYHPHPVYPPSYPISNGTNGCKYPGKQPAICRWWEVDPEDINAEEYFGTGVKYGPFNIGMSPRDGNIQIDLDSKHDEGESVRKYLADNQKKLGYIPRADTFGGAHLALYCPDLPVWKNPNGRPDHKVRTSQINADVTAELYFDPRQNIVLPPSIHPKSGKPYPWTVFGAIPEWVFAEIYALFGFEPPTATKPKSKKKEAPWHTRFRGDLRTLDLVKLFEQLGQTPELEDADENRYKVICPWLDGHSDKNDLTGAKIGHIPDHFPWFKCHHASCKSAERSLKDVLELAESKKPGIVDECCSQERLWNTQTKVHLSRDNKVQIVHGHGRLESEVYSDVGCVIGPLHKWFVRNEVVSVIEEIPCGFTYSSDPKNRYTIQSTILGFRELSGIEAKGRLEEFIEPGELQTDIFGLSTFRRKSFTTDLCSGMILSSQLKSKLDLVARILPVRLPFLIENKLVYPKIGYDRRFATYTLPSAPELVRTTIDKAWALIDSMLAGFCFANEQSRTHAIARLLTPFARDILGRTTRVPLWFFAGNRPRCGKDYLSGTTLIIYEGRAFEDFPIGKDSEETSKRLIAAARNGRRFMHFSNCQVFLQDQYLTQAITNPVIHGRSLGSNSPKSDLSLPNEMEYSISANIGLQFREDLEPRMRKIELAFYQEDANKRIFPDTFLHKTICDNRAEYLSAIATIFAHWEKAGFPIGKTPFTSFPEWGAVIGGVMAASGRGDPCLPFVSDYGESSTDGRTLAMEALFKICHAAHGEEKKLKNKEVVVTVNGYLSDLQNEPDDETEQNEADASEKAGLSDEHISALQSYLPLDHGDEAHKNQGNLIRDLRKFKNRELGNIKLIIHANSNRANRDLYQFTRINGDVPESQISTIATDVCSQSWHHGTMVAPFSESSHAGTGNDNKQKNKKAIYTYSQFPPGTVSKMVPDGANGATRSVDIFPDSLALDIETCSDHKGGQLDPWKGEIRLVSLADSARNVQLFDLKKEPLTAETVRTLAKSTLTIHNGAFELRFFGTKYDVYFENVFCTLTGVRLLSPSKTVRHDLGSVLQRYLNIEIPKKLGRSDWGAMFLTDEQLDYVRNDVRYLHQLRDVLKYELETNGLDHVFDLESKLLPIIARMEVHGFRVDREAMRRMKIEADTQSARLANEIRTAFNFPKLNIGSPEQLVEAFRSCDIQLDDTSEETLCALDDPRAKMVLDWRSHTKLSGSLKGLLTAERHGRIHAQFNPLGAVTGRFSSRKPNLQNITRGPLRSCFIRSESDRRLIVADYSQIELRIGAYLAKDEAMLEAFREKQDLHRATASAVLSKNLEDVTKDNRQLEQTKRQGRIAIYELLSAGNVLYGYEVVIIKILPAKNIMGREYPERESYPSSTKESDDWGKIAWSYGRNDLEGALERFNGLVAEQQDSSLEV